MKTVHIYQRGIHGWGIFYCREDLLVHFTIFSVISREMNIQVVAYCPMFNHTHSGIANPSQAQLERFQRRLTLTFSRVYNKEYGRTGPVFKVPYGRSTKRGIKTILGNVAYIFNNPVAGRMCKEAIDYRWTLLAYRNCPNPFSDRIYREHRRQKMREAMSRVDYCYAKGWFLNYTVLHSLFNGLTARETEQLTDYIISKYNFLDYALLDELYGSYDNLLVSLESNAGSEYDLEDEFGDHSRYWKMIAVAEKNGYSCTGLERLNQTERNRLIRLLTRKVNPDRDQLRKFLHLK